MAERQLVDLTQAQTYTAPNGAQFKLKPSSTGTLLNGPSNSSSTQTSTAASTSAIAIWKASSYDGSSQFLKDSTGNGHHMRMGSQYPAYIAKGALNLSGVTGNYASSPDSTATSITGDLDIVIRAMLPDWTPNGNMPLIAKEASSGSQRSFWFYVQNTTGNLALGLSSDGSTTNEVSSSVAPTITDGTPLWVRFTWRASDGRVQFFTAADQAVVPSSWTQLGTDQTLAVGSIYDSTAVLEVGSRRTGTVASNIGCIFYVEVRSGIGGSVVAKFDPTDLADFTTSFTSITGEVWSVNQPGAVLSSSGAGLVLPGVTNSVATVTHNVGLNVTSDIDIIWYGSLPDWTPSVAHCFVSKYQASGSRSWIFEVTSAGAFRLYISFNGTNSEGSAVSSASPVVSDGANLWTRATRRQSDGRVQFFTSNDGTNWTQLGTDQTISSGTAVYASGANFQIGQHSTGSSTAPATTKRVIVKNGIAGTTLLDIDFTAQTNSYLSSFTCTTGQKVLLGGQTGSDTADPVFLTYSGTKYVYLPGGNTNYLTIPDAPAQRVTGDYDLRVLMSMDNWQPASAGFIAAKQNSGNEFAMQMYLLAGGYMEFTWSENGTGWKWLDATEALPFAPGEKGWIRAVLDVDNGSSQYTVTYYTASGSLANPTGSDWVQLGSVRTGSGTTTVYPSTAPFYIGSNLGAGAVPAKHHRLVLKNGINGTTVLDVDTSVATAAATTFTDKHYLVTGGALQLSGATGEYASVPDSAALSVTGNIDIQVKASLYDWTPGTVQTFVGKYTTTGNLRSYLFRLQTDGKLWLYWSPDGTSGSQRSVTSSVVTGIADGATKWVRVTLDVDNDAGGVDAKFYTSDDGSAWTQLGTTVTSAGTTSIADSSSPLYIGSWGAGFDDVDHPLGKIYQVKVLNGIDGTTVLNADFSTRTDGTLSFTEESTQAATVTIPTVTNTVTINRATTGRKAVVVDRSVFLLGGDDYMDTPDHTNLNFALADSFTVLAAVRVYGTGGSQIFITKQNNSLDINPGWAVWRSSGNTYGTFGDGSHAATRTLSPGITAGVADLAAIRRDTTADTFYTANVVQGGSSSVTDPMTVTSSNVLPVTVGAYRNAPSSALAAFADMEFIGAAIYRRALTDAEIAYQIGEFL